MKSSVFETHTRLKRFPPIQLVYIVYWRLREQGLRSTFLWIYEKLARRLTGVSPLALSRVHPLLYVGGQHYPRGLKRMREAGIVAVVNMREESDDAQRGVALDHYLWLPITDDYPPDMESLSSGAAFIAAQIAAGHGVYIHCAAGVGRAPTMAMAYFISTGMDLEAARAAVLKGRPFIRTTPPQDEIIERFEEYFTTSEADKRSGDKESADNGVVTL